MPFDVSSSVRIRSNRCFDFHLIGSFALNNERVLNGAHPPTKLYLKVRDPPRLILLFGNLGYRFELRRMSLGMISKYQCDSRVDRHCYDYTVPVSGSSVI